MHLHGFEVGPELHLYRSRWLSTLEISSRRKPTRLASRHCQSIGPVFFVKPSKTTFAFLVTNLLSLVGIPSSAWNSASVSCLIKGQRKGHVCHFHLQMLCVLPRNCQPNWSHVLGKKHVVGLFWCLAFAFWTWSTGLVEQYAEGKLPKKTANPFLMTTGWLQVLGGCLWYELPTMGFHETSPCTSRHTAS